MQETVVPGAPPGTGQLVLSSLYVMIYTMSKAFIAIRRTGIFDTVVRAFFTCLSPVCLLR